MRVPLVDLQAQYRRLKQPIDEAVSRVLQSGQYVLGGEVQAFEAELAAYVGAPHCIAVSSGTDALLAAAMGLGIGLGAGEGGRLWGDCPRDAELLTTSYSFFATPETALRLGVKPVFADIEEHGLNADVDDLLRKLSSRTQAIIPVHLFGERMELSRLVATGIPIIEDAAQTLVPGLGKDTAGATLSFFPTKNLGAVGDGGAVLTHDAKLADRVRLIRQHGVKPKYVHHLWGGNFRMDPLQAAILRVKLKELPNWNAQRRKNAARYRERLADLPLVLPRDTPEHVYHHFVLRAQKRDALRAYLGERTIDAEVYYPLPLHLQPCLAKLGYRTGDCPRAERAAEEALAIPIHADLSDEQIDYVADAIRSFYKN